MENIISIILLIGTVITSFFYFKKIKFKNSTQKKWINHIKSLFPIFCIVFIIRSFIYEPFRIPSNSMVPTLLTNDFIMVKKFAYGIKDPIFNYTLFKTYLPNRGDIIVFKNPKNKNINYIKRIIGIPGDKIVYNVDTKQLTITPTCKPSQTCNLIHVQYNKNKVILKNDDEYQSDLNIFYKNSRLPHGLFHYFFSLQLIEEIINHNIHNIMLLKSIFNIYHNYHCHKYLTTKTWTVPEKNYFVMGDNRDNSMDSRYFGCIPESNLIGKATHIWMSIEFTTHGWPIKIRFHRIGSIY
ncbi:MAG: signal peptidase I [Buchnera aphidicola (Eriosoma harunire)]